MVSSGWGDGEVWEVMAKKYGISFWDSENILGLMFVMDAQPINILKVIELYTLNG